MNNGRQIPNLGLGVFRSSQTYEAVKWALQAGYRHVDTAQSYDNEDEVGRAIRDSKIPRNQVFVTTKLWVDQGYESTLKACEKSLSRLDIEYIDLYLIHSPNPGREKRLASWKAMEELVAKGKVKSIGVSNYGVHHLKELLGSNPNIRPVVNQVELHPWLTRDDIVSFCEENSILLEAYCPLTRGQKLRDPVLLKLAEKYGKEAAQILIRWSLQRGFIVIPKSERKDRIGSNGDVYDFDISDGDMAALDKCNENLCVSWDPTTRP